MNEKERNLYLMCLHEKRPKLKDYMINAISECYDLRPSVAKAYLYALDGIFAKYGEDLKRMSDDGLICLIEKESK